MTIVDSKQLANDFVKDQEDRHKNPDAYKGFRFPFPWFMQKTGGWQRSWVCYIMGRTGVGKTSVLSTAATQLGKDGVRFLYVSLEETLFLTAQRVLANIANINRVKFRDIKLEQADWPNLYVGAAELAVFNGYWLYGAYTEAEIVKAVEDVDPDVVLLDYIQLMDYPSAKTKVEEVSKASKFMVRLAKGKHTKGKELAVLVGGQLNDDDQPLWSRDLGRDADLRLDVCTIPDGSDSVLPDQRVLKLVKFRHGEIGHTICMFNGARSLVGELARSTNIPRP